MTLQQKSINRLFLSMSFIMTFCYTKYIEKKHTPAKGTNERKRTMKTFKAQIAITIKNNYNDRETREMFINQNYGYITPDDIKWNIAQDIYGSARVLDMTVHSLNDTFILTNPKISILIKIKIKQA